MRILRPNANIAAVILVAGAAALHALVGMGAGVREILLAGKAGPAPLSSGALMAQERCRENVMIIHDVHWAVACEANAAEEKARRIECLRAQAAGHAASGAVSCALALEPPDDSPECTLPMERALVLNTARSAAENLCVDEAAEVERLAGSSAATR